MTAVTAGHTRWGFFYRVSPAAASPASTPPVPRPPRFARLTNRSRECLSATTPAHPVSRMPLCRCAVHPVAQIPLLPLRRPSGLANAPLPLRASIRSRKCPFAATSARSASRLPLHHNVRACNHEAAIAASAQPVRRQPFHGCIHPHAGTAYQPTIGTSVRCSTHRQRSTPLAGCAAGKHRSQAANYRPFRVTQAFEVVWDFSPASAP